MHKPELILKHVITDVTVMVGSVFVVLYSHTEASEVAFLFGNRR